MSYIAPQPDNNTDPRARKMCRLLASIQKIAACHNYNEIFHLLLNELSEILDARGGSIFEFSEGRLVLKHVIDPGHVPDSIHLPLSPQSPIQKAMNFKEPFFFPNVEIQEEMSSGWKGYNDGSFLVIPMTDSNGDIICMINLHNKEVPPFNEEDLELGQFFASTCSEILNLFKINMFLDLKQQYFHEFIRQAPTGFVIFNAAGSIFDVSPFFSDLLGLTPGHCLAKNYWDLTHETDREKERSIISGISSRRVVSLSKSFISEPGQPVPVQMRYTLFKEDGRQRIIATCIPAENEYARASISTRPGSTSLT